MAVDLSKLDPPILAGFGNPILDIYVNVKDNSFYTIYDLDSNSAKEINSEDYRSVINYFKKENCDFKYGIGGSVQNTLRVFQWLIKLPYYSVFFGGVGDDERGKLMEKEVNKAGVHTRYAKDKSHATAVCIVIINGVERCFLGHLGAANVYMDSDFNKKENLELFKTLFVVYIEGYFVVHSFQTALEIVRLCKINGVAVAYNLSGTYIFKNYYNEILRLIESADIVIGNVQEYKEFWNYYKGDSCGMREMLSHIQSSVITQQENIDKVPLKLSTFKKTDRIVICTQGCDNVLSVYENKEYLEVMPKVIDKSLIKDTTGAGDAFAGGFLAGILQNKNMKESIELGCSAAEQIIQRIGVLQDPVKHEDWFSLICDPEHGEHV